MRTFMIIRRYRSAIGIETKEKEKEKKRDQKGQSCDRRNNDSSRDRLRGRRSSEDRRDSTSKDRRNSNDKEKIITETFIEEGFLQICGPTAEKEMQAIQDILYPLEKAPYKLQCTCPHCISYSYEMTSPDKQFTEPFMRAINLVFSTISRYGYTLQSTSSVQNADQSSTTTWVWVRTPSDQAENPSENKEEEEDTRPRRKY